MYKIKPFTPIACALLAAIILSACSAQTHRGETIYTSTGMIVSGEPQDDCVLYTFEDESGNLFGFYADKNDFEARQSVSVTFSDNGTDTITDDIVLEVE